MINIVNVQETANTNPLFNQLISPSAAYMRPWFGSTLRLWLVAYSAQSIGLHNDLVPNRRQTIIITCTEICGIGRMFPSDNFWIGLDTYMNCILIYHLLLKVWLTGCATCFICIDWWGRGMPMLACPFRALVVLYRMLPIFTKYEMSNIWATVSTIVQLSGMFPPTDFLFEKRIGLVSMDFLYIIFTYYTQENWQGCFRRSNWFSLRCLGPWMNHLPPVRWANFRFRFLNESWRVSIT